MLVRFLVDLLLQVIFRVNEQGQYVDNFRLRNRAVTPTVPSDVTAFPTTGAFGLSYTWVDTAFFTTYLNQYDYIDYVGWGLKVDKNADAKTWHKGAQTNTQLGFTRTAVTPVTGTALTMSNTGFGLVMQVSSLLTLMMLQLTMTQGTESLLILRMFGVLELQLFLLLDLRNLRLLQLLKIDITSKLLLQLRSIMFKN